MNNYAFSGNLTKDPELRTTNSSKNVVNFSVAINTGKDETMFLKCVAWEKTADTISKYYKKGQRFSGVGSLSEEKYTDKNTGVEVKNTLVTVLSCDLPPKEQSHATGNGHAVTSVYKDEFDSDTIPF